MKNSKGSTQSKEEAAEIIYHVHYHYVIPKDSDGFSFPKHLRRVRSQEQMIIDKIRQNPPRMSFQTPIRRKPSERNDCGRERVQTKSYSRSQQEDQLINNPNKMFSLQGIEQKIKEEHRLDFRKRKQGQHSKIQTCRNNYSPRTEPKQYKKSSLTPRLDRQQLNNPQKMSSKKVEFDLSSSNDYMETERKIQKEGDYRSLRQAYLLEECQYLRRMFLEHYQFRH